MLLVCKEWQNGFASGLLRLMPRVLKIREVADRLSANLPCKGHRLSLAGQAYKSKISGTLMKLYLQVVGVRSAAILGIPCLKQGMVAYSTLATKNTENDSISWWKEGIAVGIQF